MPRRSLPCLFLAVAAGDWQFLLLLAEYHPALCGLHHHLDAPAFSCNSSPLKRVPVVLKYSPLGGGHISS